LDGESIEGKRVKDAVKDAVTVTNPFPARLHGSVLTHPPLVQPLNVDPAGRCL